MKPLTNRRKFVQSLAALSAFPILAPALLKAGQLDPENAQAKALQYTHTSAMADKICGNCQLYTGDPAAEWGPCAIFPGQEVASAGWCTAWVQKA